MPVGDQPGESTETPIDESAKAPGPRLRAALLALAAATGLALMADSIRTSSATYDEVMYLQVAARWWRTGDQTRITRAGSPLTFWKLQQIPMLWSLDRLGYGAWIDNPVRYEANLLPLARASALWIWLVAFGLVAYWSHRLHGPRAMLLAAWWFTLSPNLLAHGSLVTMETPILAAMTGMTLLFWIFLRTGDRRAFVASAGVGGLAFSCKFSAAVVPPILGLLWLVDRWSRDDRRPVSRLLAVARGMALYVAIMIASDVLVTGFALLPISPRTGDHPSIDGPLGSSLAHAIGRLLETPVPQDWVGFIKQAMHQRNGTPGYLLGEVRDRGWRYYYLVALAVKVPLAFWAIFAMRAALSRRLPSAERAWFLPSFALAFLAVASLGSTRNLGIRYLLPVAPLAIVWASALASGTVTLRRVAWCGLAAQAMAVAASHPSELTYFNALAGGPIGGRKILSDSNLDWGQGLKPLAQLQHTRPELRDLTLFYFGDSEAARYGVAGRSYTVREGTTNTHVPPALAPDTAFVAVSATLQYGPWAASGFFRPLEGITPICYTPDTTIAIYRTADLSAEGAEPNRRSLRASNRIATAIP